MQNDRSASLNDVLLADAAPAARGVLAAHFERRLQNAASYRPFQLMSPIEIMTFLEERGYKPDFIDEAMRRIVAARAIIATRQAKLKPVTTRRGRKPRA